MSGPCRGRGGFLLGPGSAVRTGEPQPSPAPPPPAGLLQGYRYLRKVVQKTRLPRSLGTESSKKRRAPNFILVCKSHTTGSQRRAARAEGGGAALGGGKRRFWSENLEEEKGKRGPGEVGKAPVQAWGGTGVSPVSGGGAVGRFHFPAASLSSGGTKSSAQTPTPSGQTGFLQKVFRVRRGSSETPRDAGAGREGFCSGPGGSLGQPPDFAGRLSLPTRALIFV